MLFDVLFTGYRVVTPAGHHPQLMVSDRYGSTRNRRDHTQLTGNRAKLHTERKGNYLDRYNGVDRLPEQIAN